MNTARPETRTQAVIRSDVGVLVLLDRRVGDGEKGWSLVSATPQYCLLLPSEMGNQSVVKCHLEGVN